MTIKQVKTVLKQAHLQPFPLLVDHGESFPSKYVYNYVRAFKVHNNSYFAQRFAVIILIWVPFAVCSGRKLQT